MYTVYVYIHDYIYTSLHHGLFHQLLQNAYSDMVDIFFGSSKPLKVWQISTLPLVELSRERSSVMAMGLRFFFFFCGIL